MGREWIFTVVLWAVWSGFVAAGIIYLGANTEPYRDRWPIAGLTGAALGGVGGLTALRLLGQRRGVLLLAIPFGLIFGVGVSFLWAGK